MASIILKTVGSAIGTSLFGAAGGVFLGALGGIAGSFADGALGITGGKVEGPRLDNLSVQDSRYGAGIPIVYGNMRTAGNVIWSTDLMQTTHTQNVGGKGGGGGETVQTYTYSVHCAVGICAGPIGGINTIWADSKVIYQDGVWTSGILGTATIYTGTSTQNPDAFMESMLGSGNVPAHRGLAYVVFESLQLANFGNRLPNLTFEVLPVPVSADPQWLGDVDAAIDVRPQTSLGHGLPPIVLSGNSASARQVLIGGYQSPGSSCTFEVVEYDVTGDMPVELDRIQSSSFSAADIQDHSWASAPDGRYIALYLQDAAAPTHRFVIYDVETQQFGMVLEIDMGSSSVTKQLAWIDPQHFVIDHTSGGIRGLRVLARAGRDIVDLGFFNVWGTGSASTRQPLSYAQFTPLAGGLINYMTDVSGLSFTALYARQLVWQNNSLIVGNAYTLASGISPGSGSGPAANFIRTGGNEWTVCYSTTTDYTLMSFVPGISSASITRAWQQFTPSFGSGSTAQPLCYGDRLVLAQRGTFDNAYRLSEVMLNAGNFSLALDAQPVDNVTALTGHFDTVRINSSKLLLGGVGGSSSDMGQLGIIKRCDTGDSLDKIVGDILTRAGYDDADFDVTALAATVIDGYILQEPMTARAAIQPLQAFQTFDLIESDQQLKAVLRNGAAAATIPATEWRAASDKSAPAPAQEIIRAQELDLPAEVDIDFVDAARDFEVNCQRARRIATQAKAIHKMSLPIVCSAQTAKQIAEARLYTRWAERELIKLRYSRRYLAIEPGDVVDLDDRNLMRITSINQAGGLIEAQGFLIYGAAGTSIAAADTGQTTDHDGIAARYTTLYLMDLPLLRSADDQPGVYTAVTGLPGWIGASIWRSADGISYTDIIGISTPAMSGLATTVLADAPSYYMDSTNSVNVQLIQGELSNCSSTDLLNGANAALLGNEIIQFQTATLIGPGLYRLSNLLRGRRATESTTATHAIGENFILLTQGSLDFLPALIADRGRAYEFRALSTGQSLGETSDNEFTYNLKTLQPFAPAHVTGKRASGTGSDLTMTWVRRARLNADWVDYIDVPLDEPEELYDLEIMNGSNVVRTFSSLTAPTATYTAAQQTSDWGSPPASYSMNVYQLSSRYGRGQAATAVI